MNAEQFAYWLQGYAELTDGPPSAEQWQMIQEHLALVFNKVTPPLSGWVARPPLSYPSPGHFVVTDDLRGRSVC
jgi:hypothetical protein